MARDVLTYAIGNSASTTSSSSITNSATSLPLTSDTNFAAASGEGMVVIDEGNAGEEFAYATTKSGSSLTIPLANRGLEGTSAAAHDSGVTVKGILTATMWNDLIDSLTNVLSKTTGAVDTTKVVTLTGTQTLTNKTLTSPALTNADVANSGNADALDITNGGTTNALDISCTSTGRALSISSTGLGSGGKLMYVSSNSASANDSVMYFTQEHVSSSAECIRLANEGTGSGLVIDNNGNCAGNGVIYVDHAGTGINTYLESKGAANGVVLRCVQGSATSAAAVLSLKQTDTDVAIITEDGGGSLSASGVWTDRPSTYAQKMNINELEVDGFIDKLKDMKMFRYQKRCEVYGAEEEWKDAPYHIGHILDDPSTPEELIERDREGKITGLSSQRGIHFLLATVKELINRVEELESK